MKKYANIHTIYKVAPINDVARTDVQRQCHGLTTYTEWPLGQTSQKSRSPNTPTIVKPTAMTALLTATVTSPPSP